MSGFTVREARPDELDEAGRLVADAYLHQGGIDASDPEYLDEIRNARARAGSCAILVAVEKGSGALLGSVTYVSGPGTPWSEMERDGEAGFRMLGVAPWAQRRGVGEALTVACVERARAEGRRAVAICTVEDGDRARRLYERLGFVRDETRDFEPVPGIRLLAMVRAL